jgi:hypothetical protein
MCHWHSFLSSRNMYLLPKFYSKKLTAAPFPPLNGVWSEVFLAVILRCKWPDRLIWEKPEAVGGCCACLCLVFLTLLLVKASFLKHILNSWLKEEMVGRFQKPVGLYTPATILLNWYNQVILHPSFTPWNCRFLELVTKWRRADCLKLHTSVLLLKKNLVLIVHPSACLDMLAKRKVTASTGNWILTYSYISSIYWAYCKM